MKIVMLFLGVLVSQSAVASQGYGNCQTQGPVEVCVVEGRGIPTGDSYTVTYNGYLLQSGASIHVGAIMNGSVLDLEPLVMGEAPILGRGGRTTNLEIYFVNDRGEYDSRFGANYRFTFHF
jgi:hypothetical protein